MENKSRERIFEIKDRNAVTIIKEFTKDGSRIPFNLVGEVKGKYSGMHTETALVI